ncbi:MAG: GMP synthase (glutamine-hydrolyzing) [Myxococcota bacterium]|jgi:GMP synthase (glutamine-hydrolysing)
MTSPLRLLVIDAYTDAGRASLKAADCRFAGALYEHTLHRLDPMLQVDVINASSPYPALPDGAAVTDYHGVIWTGSNLTAHQDTESVRGQIALCRAHLAAGVPGFGSCWAAQLAVVATGGTVAANPRGREFGVCRKIALSSAGRAHPMYLGKPTVFDGYTSHEDEITHVGSNTIVLCGNAFSRVQAVHVTTHQSWFWAVQYHPEYEPIDVARLGIVRRDQLIRQGDFADVADNADYARALEALQADPTRRNIAFRLGIEDDLLDFTSRTIEVRNWLSALRNSAQAT